MCNADCFSLLLTFYQLQGLLLPLLNLSAPRVSLDLQDSLSKNCLVKSNLRPLKSSNRLSLTWLKSVLFLTRFAFSLRICHELVLSDFIWLAVYYMNSGFGLKKCLEPSIAII